MVFCGLFHDPGSSLAGVLALTLMFGELNSQALLRVPSACGDRSLELTRTMGADGDRGNGAEPFHNPETTFRHG
jgi:hypothetical protein